MDLRAAVRPFLRAAWVLPLAVGILVAVLDVARVFGVRVPGGGAAAAVLVIYTAYRAGPIPGLIGAGLVSLFTLRSIEAGYAVPGLAIVFALYAAVFLVGVLAQRQRRALEQAMAARLNAESAGERYRELVDGLEAVVWEADAESLAIRFVSRRAEHLFRFPVSAWLGSADIWQRLIHRDDYTETIARCRQAGRDGCDHRVDSRMVTASGEVLHVRNLVQIDKTVVPAVLRGVMLDVTAEQRARRQLEETSARWNSFISNAADALFICSRETIVEVNDRACQTLGYSREELLRLKVTDIDVNSAQKQIAAVDYGSLQKSPMTVEGVLRRKDGSEFPVELSIALWDAKEPVQVIVLARDITRKSQLQDQLRQAQKMEAVGRLAGGIAHDFNNLLTAIKGHADLLNNELGLSTQPDLLEISRAADRAAALTRQLLAFSRQQMLQLQVLSINAVVQDMQKMLGRLIGEHITLITALDPGAPHIEADRTQLEQVLLNLVLNARDAITTSGRITIRTADSELTDADAHKFVFVQPGPYVMLEVADTGSGMDAETASKVFEPFFTTKEQGKGSGLGLATAYGIVKQLGGYIWCESEPGNGTVFRVYLPPTKAPAPDPTAHVPRVQVQRGSETILVVEDEAAVRSLVRRVLQKSGYNVISASNGIEAIQIVAEYNRPIHLLLTDLVMPEMGGRDLADRLAPERPDMKILYMSGYAEDAIIVNHVLQPGFAFLPKPFAPDILASKVREILST